MRLLVLACTATVLLGVAAARAEPPPPILPAPYATNSAVKVSRVVPWPAGQTPTAPAGFRVNRYFAGELLNPRWSIQLPNGDVLVSEAYTGASGQGRILLLRDANGDGVAEQSFLFLENERGNLNQPFGTALVGGFLYVANTDGVWRYPYATGATRIAGASGVKVLDLPADGYNNHWTRNVVASKDGRQLLVTVGSATNVDVELQDARDPRRAAILAYTIENGRSRVLATGLRNPNGLDFNPRTGRLWTVVNERDELGDDLVPDFLTSIVDRGFYGWPWRYFGAYADPRKPNPPATLPRAIVPDLAVGAHTATLGLTFYRGSAFPKIYRQGAFIGQRGSWNRARFAGYRVAFVPFDRNGNVAGGPQDFLTGFVANEARSEVWGRPVDVTELRDGSLLVNDDAGKRLWRVSYDGSGPVPAPALGGLFLMNAATEATIEPLVDGATIDLARVGTSSLAVVAPPASRTVASVRFELDGAVISTDSSAPFSLAGDAGLSDRDDYFGWTATPGPHVLVATPFSGAGGSGVAGTPVTVRFTVR